jgi:hypothetical protein
MTTHNETFHICNPYDKYKLSLPLHIILQTPIKKKYLLYLDFENVFDPSIILDSLQSWRFLAFHKGHHYNCNYIYKYHYLFLRQYFGTTKPIREDLTEVYKGDKIQAHEGAKPLGWGRERAQASFPWPTRLSGLQVRCQSSSKQDIKPSKAIHFSEKYQRWHS